MFKGLDEDAEAGRGETNEGIFGELEGSGRISRVMVKQWPQTPAFGNQERQAHEKAKTEEKISFPEERVTEGKIYLKNNLSYSLDKSGKMKKNLAARQGVWHV